MDGINNKICFIITVLSFVTFLVGQIYFYVCTRKTRTLDIDKTLELYKGVNFLISALIMLNIIGTIVLTAYNTANHNFTLATISFAGMSILIVLFQWNYDKHQKFIAEATKDI